MKLSKLLYTYRETADLLSISYDSVLRRVEEGHLRRVYINQRDPRITAESILRYYKTLPEAPVTEKS